MDGPLLTEGTYDLAPFGSPAYNGYQESYDAVSYVWRPSQDSRLIYCNDEPVHIITLQPAQRLTADLAEAAEAQNMGRPPLHLFVSDCNETSRKLENFVSVF